MSTQRIGQLVDVAAVREQAREDWERAQKNRLSVQEKIGFSVPWWIVILAFTLFTLSIPHTMSVFAQITPTFGYVAPFGIEFGLLYYAFRSKQESGGVPWTLHALGLLFFVTSIIVNAAGSLQAVVSLHESTRNMPAQELIYSFSELPARSQVALFLVPVAALFIPIGTLATGEGLAALFLERDAKRDPLSARWERVRTAVEFEALLDAALTEGVPVNRAIRWARMVARYEVQSVQQNVQAEQTLEQRKTVQGRSIEGERRHSADDSDVQKSKAERVIEHLEQHEQDVQLSVRQLADKFDVSVGTAHNALKKFQSRNGHED